MRKVAQLLVIFHFAEQSKKLRGVEQPHFKTIIAFLNDTAKNRCRDINLYGIFHESLYSYIQDIINVNDLGNLNLELFYITIAIWYKNEHKKFYSIQIDQFSPDHKILHNIIKNLNVPYTYYKKSNATVDKILLSINIIAFLS